MDSGTAEFSDALKKSGFKGDIDNSQPTRELNSHDASLFELMPEVVVAPKDGSSKVLSVT